MVFFFAPENVICVLFLVFQYGSVGPSLDKIVNLAHMMRGSMDPIVKNLAGTLSTRQLLRIAHRMSVYSPEEVTILRAIAVRE